MGIFKNFATSVSGDVTLGALGELTNVAQRDAKNNAVIATNSLTKENEEFKITERAFDNKKQINNILAANPEAFGIVPNGNLTVEMIADRLTNSIFTEQRSIFEYQDFDKVKAGVARYLARDPGKGFELKDPYVPSENLFETEQNKHADKLSAISKMPRADKLLFNLKKIDEESTDNFATVNQVTKVASITAKGYGILKTFPGTIEGNTNLNFAKTNIIVANAKSLFPNDAVKRSKFIDQKLYENGINPLDAIGFKSPMTYKAISNVIDAAGDTVSVQLANNFGLIANATGLEKENLIKLNDQLILNQLELVNNFSAKGSQVIAGINRATVFPSEETQETQETFVKQEIPPGYKPQINKRGSVILPFGNELPLDNLFANYEANKKVLPDEVLKFVEPLRQYFDKDGGMIKPERNMLPEGEQGDILFGKLLRIYNFLMPEDDLATLGGYGKISEDDFRFVMPKRKTETFIDPTKLKKKDNKNKK